MAALNSELINPNNGSTINFQQENELNEIMRVAFSHLHPGEARRRLFLVVSITFHSIADICRAKDIKSTNNVLRNHKAMFEQLVRAVESLIGARRTQPKKSDRYPAGLYQIGDDQARS